MAKRQYFVAVPSERKLEREGAPSILITAAGLVMWDFGGIHRPYHPHIEGDYILLECNVRGDRKRLRERIERGYMLPTHTVVR